ncbi:MAG TPA: metal ABC transporter permease [Solirubrobacteraceae bacterium]|nr:metal ABC transporter permease [Solirubrobacteraceae bacterium]
MNPVLRPDLITDVRELIQYPFMVSALEAGTIVAVLAALAGWFVVLRRQAFAGHTLSVMAFPGAAGATLAGLPAALGYYVACAAAALVLAVPGTAPRRRGGGSQETALVGTVQTVGLAAGFLFLSLNAGLLGSPETLLFGSFLGITRREVLTLLGVGVIVLGALAAVGRPLLFASVDRDGARAGGVPIRALDLTFLLVLALAVAATSQITGALLSFALLVAPPAAASHLVRAPGRALLLSVAFGLITVWLALALAYFTVYPVGFYATTISSLIYVAARLLKRS